MPCRLVPLNRRPGRPSRRPIRSAVQKHIWPLPEIEARFLSRVAYSFVTIPSDLPQLHNRMVVASGGLVALKPEPTIERTHLSHSHNLLPEDPP